MRNQTTEPLRHLFAVAVATAALAGCDPNVPMTPAEVTAGFNTTIPYEEPQTCFGEAPCAPRVGSDPWQGRRGYIVFHAMTRVCDVASEQDAWGVIGYDSTMTHVLWVTEVDDMEGVAALQRLPGTIPFQCAYTPDAGQVGSANTNTGGDHQCCSTVCVPTSEIDHLRSSCLCQPKTAERACAGVECGNVGDGCGGTIWCSGSCGAGETCKGNSCVRKCPTTSCGKGAYRDPDSCACVHGIPE